MIGVYFSGTGNTKYCLTRIMNNLGSKNIQSIEENNVLEEIKKEEIIYFAYPIQFSFYPLIVENFIKNNKELWKNKKVFLIATMGLFSGDGAGSVARLLKKYEAKIIGGLHLRMPDSVADKTTLIKPFEKNKQIITKTEEKIKLTSELIKQGKYPHEGLSFLRHLCGLFGQRLWFKNYNKRCKNKLKINKDCLQCGLCVNNCPMHNLELKDGKIESLGNCTLCYRCVNNCPKEAITILGSKVIEQIKIEKFIK